MNNITSKLLSQHKIPHGFGMAGFLLGDYLQELWIKDAKFFNTDQLHSDSVVLLSTDHESRTTLQADAFITNEPGIVCSVRTADCVPILMFDPVKKAVGAVHAGWRGTAKRVAVKVVERFIHEFGSRREDICVAIGPAIVGKCYEVDSEVAESFISIAGDHMKKGTRRGKWNLDLQQINKAILEKEGITKLEVIPICSHCDKRFASYRRDRSEDGRQVNFILLNTHD